MTRACWFIAGSWLLLFWLLAGTVWGPMLERRLARQAILLTDAVPTGYPAVMVSFSGQQAQVTGKVRHEAQRQEILNRLKQQVRTPGWLSAGLNPVTAVRDDLEIAPYPTGWLLLAGQGSRGRLLGTLASDYEARDVGRLMEDRWTKAGGLLITEVKTDSGRFDEAPGIQMSLDQLPAPRPAMGGESGQVQIARLGGGWERLMLEATDDRVREGLKAYPITEAEWQSVIKPALDQVRRYQDSERARIAEAERQAKLPPPHVFLAARDQRVLLRGEVASMKIKRELLNAVIGAFPEWRVIDDLRVNAGRRAVAEFGPITTALLPLSQDTGAGKSLALGLSGVAWEFVDWQSGEDTQPLKKLLPADLPVPLLMEDRRMVTQWLQGSALGIPTLPIPAQPSFLTLTLLPDKVILAGQLAEEPLRARLVEAVKNAYAVQAVLFSEALLARGTCEPTVEVEQTVRSLPPLPKPGEAPVLAFARPGQVWKSQPATPQLLEAGALAKSPLLPMNFPAAMAEDTFAAEAYDHIRHYWRNPPQGTTTR